MAILIFAGKAFVIVAALMVVIGFIAVMAARASQKPLIEVEDLNHHYRRLEQVLKFQSLNDADLKAEKKRLKKRKKDPKPKNRVFVIDFKGDIKASEVENLREEVTALLTTAQQEDEVVIRLESPGGVVHGYGLAASQLVRLRDKNIPLTVCVDKVAASGGYLMACTAHKILCAPFGIVGSVGVVAQVPNFNRLLKKHDVDFKEYTAGEFKRTVSIFGEITPKGEHKFIEQLEDTHHLFKNFVHRFRPHLDLHRTATGEYWYGDNAKALGLVDEIMTSDAYLTERSQTHRVLKIKYEKKQGWNEKLSGMMGKIAEKSLLRVFSELEKSRLI
jgi:serine protease SohB